MANSDIEKRRKTVDRAATAGILVGILAAPFTGGASLVGSIGVAISAAMAHAELDAQEERKRKDC